MTHSLKTEFFWGGGPNGKVVALGILVICPVDKNPDSKYQNFWVKIAHFCSLRTIGAAPVNVFNTKEVSHWFPDMKVLLSPSKKWKFGPKKGQIGPTGIFGQISAFLAHLI